MSCKKVVFGIFTLFLSLISFTYGTNYSVYHNSTDGLISIVSGNQTILTLQDHVVGQNCTYQEYLNGFCSQDDFLGCFFQAHNNYCFRYNGLVNKSYNFINAGSVGWDRPTQYTDYYFYTGGYDRNLSNNNCNLTEYNYNVPYYISGNYTPFYQLNMYNQADNLHYYCGGVNAYLYGGTFGSLVDYFKIYSPWFNSGSKYGVSPCGTGFSIFNYIPFYKSISTGFVFVFNSYLGDFGIFSHGYFNNKGVFQASTNRFWSTDLINKSSTSSYSGYISYQPISSITNYGVSYFNNLISLIYSTITSSSSNYNHGLSMFCQSDSVITPSGNNWSLVQTYCDGSDCGSSAGSSSYTVNYNNGQTQSFTIDQSITINGYSLYNGNGSFSPYINISYTDQDNQVLTESYDKTNLILGGKFNKTYTGGESNFWVLSAISQGSIPDIIYTGLEFTGSSNISGNIFTNFVDNSFDVIGTNIPNFISYGFVLIVLIILIRLIKHFKKGGKGRI